LRPIHGDDGPDPSHLAREAIMKMDDEPVAGRPAQEAELSDEDLDGVDGGVLFGPGPSPTPLDTLDTFD
jgi:hypothetical protein